MRIEVQQNAGETGELEELTWDLFPLVDASHTLHLDGSGLPKVGTRITPGMILVGKIAKTRTYDPERQPTPLEIHGLERKTLCSKYSHMWQDTSLYANETRSGVVQSASFEERDGSIVAVVLLDPDRPPSARPDSPGGPPANELLSRDREPKAMLVPEVLRRADDLIGEVVTIEGYLGVNAYRAFLIAEFPAFERKEAILVHDQGRIATYLQQILSVYVGGPFLYFEEAILTGTVDRGAEWVELRHLRLCRVRVDGAELEVPVSGSAAVTERPGLLPEGHDRNLVDS